MQLGDRIASRIKLLDLHILMAVAQAGSMNKAAAALNMSQPAVSRSIAELERAVGVSLLDRNARGVEPTAYGRALLDGGVAAFDELHQAMKNIQCLADPTRGEVRIGCSSFLAATFVSAVVDRLSRRYPRIVFRVEAAATIEAQHRALSERNVDFLISQRFGLLADEQLSFDPLYVDTYAVVAGVLHPRARSRKMKLADLVSESWVLPPPEDVLGSVYRDVFRSNGIEYPRAIVFTNPPEMRISLLATGRFLTIFSTTILRYSPQRLRLKVLPVEINSPRVPVGIVTLKNRALSSVAKLFIEHAREVAKPTARHRR